MREERVERLDRASCGSMRVAKRSVRRRRAGHEIVPLRGRAIDGAEANEKQAELLEKALVALRARKRAVKEVRGAKRHVADYVVYRIVDPRDGKPFYVGQTSDAQMRWLDHLERERPLTRRRRRIKAILAEGLVPVFEVVAEAGTRDEALAKELETLKRYVEVGYEMANRKGTVEYYRRKGAKPKADR